MTSEEERRVRARRYDQVVEATSGEDEIPRRRGIGAHGPGWCGQESPVANPIVVPAHDGEVGRRVVDGEPQDIAEPHVVEGRGDHDLGSRCRARPVDELDVSALVRVEPGDAVRPGHLGVRRGRPRDARSGLGRHDRLVPDRPRLDGIEDRSRRGRADERSSEGDVGDDHDRRVVRSCRRGGFGEAHLLDRAQERRCEHGDQHREGREGGQGDGGCRATSDARDPRGTCHRTSSCRHDEWTLPHFGRPRGGPAVRTSFRADRVTHG